MEVCEPADSVTDKLNIDEIESEKLMQENDDAEKNESTIDVKEDEKPISMHSKELERSLDHFICKYLTDYAKNNLFGVESEFLEQESLFRKKVVEAEKMKKFFNILMQDQEKYFRHVGILPKIDMWNVGVHVDLPSEISFPLTGSELSDVSKEKAIPTTSNAAQQSSATSEGQQDAASDNNQASDPSTSSVEVIDLTDEEDLNSRKAQQNASSRSLVSGGMPPSNSYPLKHPAPLPPKPYTPMNKTHLNPPPKPTLRISAEKQGIVLQWNLTLIHHHAPIKTYEIYGYQESKKGPINYTLWKKIGDVKALILPMACTLTQFVEGFKYHFTIRALDEFLRPGPYSDPASITFQAQYANAAKKN